MPGLRGAKVPKQLYRNECSLNWLAGLGLARAAVPLAGETCEGRCPCGVLSVWSGIMCQLGVMVRLGTGRGELVL